MSLFGVFNGKKPLVILLYPKIDHEKNYVYFWMPFSLLMVAQPLLSEGLVDVVIFDGNLNSDDEWCQFLDKHLERTICIGVSIMTGGGQIGHALRLVRLAKDRPDCPLVVFGGPHVNVLGEQTAEHPLVDVVLKGPGQNSFLYFVKALLSNAGLESVPGLLAKKNGVLLRGVNNPSRTGVMGNYPWHLLDVERYVRNDPTVAPRTLNYVSSQGCTYKCQFCYEQTYKRTYSSMLPDALFDDICLLKQRFGLSGIKFYDADWFINLRRAKTFCDLVIKHNLGIRWAASINPNDIIRAECSGIPLLDLIAQSGGRRLLMGVESGNDRVLADVVRKEITRAKMIDVACRIAATGIIGSYTFIVGFPGESESEINDTYTLIDEIRKFDRNAETRVHLFAPYPGTPLFDTCVANGFQPPSSLEEWSDYDYYSSQTPWTTDAMARRAQENTNMWLTPDAAT